MKTILSHVKKHPLLTLGIGIHIIFYVSAIGPGWLNVFFSGPATHYQFYGVDFFQVLRGAWSWWHGGSLSVAAIVKSGVYAPTYHFVNPNVYHPLFTILVGSPLMLFSPSTSYVVWIVVKGLLDTALLVFFWRQVRALRYGEFATFVLLASIDEYAELVAGQYHFLLNACLLMFLLMMQRRSTVASVLWYAASIIVKPIGLLFVPTLVARRHWRIVLFALALVAMATWPFLLNRSGLYYINNLAAAFFHPHYPGPDQIMTLNAMLRFTFNWPGAAYQAIQYTALALVLLVSANRRADMMVPIFFSVVYFLCFYDLVFEYDYSTLAYVLAVGVVFCPAFQSRAARICILLTCLPSCFVVLRILHVDVSFDPRIAYHPGIVAWRWMVASKVVPVLALCGIVLVGDVRYWVKWIAQRRSTLHSDMSGAARFRGEM